MARHGQKATEQLNLTRVDRCEACSFIQANKGRVVVVPDQLASVKMFPCVRYPQPVLKELGDWCGEFKAR